MAPGAPPDAGAERRSNMEITSFRDMYLAELQEMRSVEMQLTEGWRRVAEVASHAELKNAFMRCFEETQVRKERLDDLLRQYHANPQAHVDQAMLQETEKMMSIVRGNDLRDAGLIASAQKVVHYLIAAYGTGAALAGQLDLRDDQQTLHTGLEEAKKVDSTLSEIAKRAVNPDAAITA
jgi:ferritin-like metal-binding protein YciE